MSAELINEIRQLDESIKLDEDRRAAVDVRIGTAKRRREALFNSLSPEEKKQLEPEAPPPPSKPQSETKSK